MYTVANWRGKFINSLIKDLGLKSYLELGISKGWCWQEIELENKTGIEINPEIQDNRIIKSTTDDFFKANSKKFDIIFIDADHEKGQVFKDFTNAYEALNDRGLVLLHDVNPLQKSDVSLSDMGTAYAFWVNLVCWNSR
jgi:predicted O-methyltransferase YrrM